MHLRRVRIGNNTGNTAFAINFQPNGPAKLFVTDSFIYNFGSQLDFRRNPPEAHPVSPPRS